MSWSSDNMILAALEYYTQDYDVNNFDMGGGA